MQNSLSRLDMVAVALRVFALYLLVQAFRQSSFLVQTWGTVSTLEACLVFAVVQLPLLLIAGFIWFFPISVAKKFLPSVRDSGEAIRSESEHLQEIAFSLLGVWVLVSAAADAVYWVSYLHLLVRSGASWSYLPAEHVASSISTLAELLLGLWLTFGSKGILGAIRRFRSAGAPRSEPALPSDESQ